MHAYCEFAYLFYFICLFLLSLTLWHVVYDTHTHIVRMCRLLSNVCVCWAYKNSYTRAMVWHPTPKVLLCYVTRCSCLTTCFYIHFIGNCCAHKTLFDTFSISWCVPLLCRSFVPIFIYFRQPFGAGGVRERWIQWRKLYSSSHRVALAMFFSVALLLHILILFSFIRRRLSSSIFYLSFR